MTDNSQSNRIETTFLVSKNDAKYDILKFFLSLMILAIHSVIYPLLLYPWLRMAVPLFFIISSKFVFSKLKNATREDQKNILKKFVFRNLQLYFSWFVILLPATVYLRKESYFSHGLLKNVSNIIKSILFGSSFYASWFIMASVIGVIIIFFLSKLLRSDVLVFLFALFAFCFVTIASSYRYHFVGTFVNTAIIKYTRLFGGLVYSFPAAIFWVFIGKLFAEEKIKFKSSALLIFLTICSFAALFFEWKFIISRTGAYKNDSYFMLSLACILLFACLEKIEPIYWKNSLYLRRASTIIYVTHGSALLLISKLVSIVFNSQIPLLSFAVTLICSIAIYILIEIAIKLSSKQKINKILKWLY